MKRSFLCSWLASRRVSRGSLAGLAATLLCAAVLPGCVDPDHPVARDNSAMLPDDQRVSSVPWNKPQGWEDKSQLGAMANDPRIGGGGTKY